MDGADSLSHAFISYQRQDHANALAVANAIERRGVPVFIDERIEIGARWDDVLDNALRRSFAIVVLWSPRSVNSRWVRLEARFALDQGRLCPAFIDLCDAPIEFSDIEGANLVNWDGADENSEWILLINAICRLRSEPPTNRPSMQATVYYILGERFEHGVGGPKSTLIAAQMYSRARDAGHPAAESSIERLRYESD